MRKALLLTSLAFPLIGSSDRAPFEESSPLENLISRCDLNGDGRVDLTEYPTFFSVGVAETELNHASFDELDGDRDGAITVADGAAPETRPPKEPYGSVSRVSAQARRSLAREEEGKREKIAAVREVREEVTGGFTLYRCDVPITGLPAELEGVAILQISDLHLEASESSLLHTLRELILAIPKTPDLVAITGDVFENGYRDVTPEALDTLNDIFPDALRVAVLGNHDFYGGDHEKVRRALVGAGYRDLTNCTLSLKINGKPLHITGVDDALYGTPVLPVPPHSEKFEPRILIAHNLDALTNRATKGIDLVLSGHTHCGEIDLGFFNGTDLLKLKGRFADINRQIGGFKALTWRTLSYISPGLGTQTTRFNVPEAGVTVLTLKSFASSGE